MKKHAKKSKRHGSVINHGGEILEKISEGVNPPGIQYYVGKRRGMQELADIARPRFDKLIKQERGKSEKAIRALTTTFKNQYDDDIKALWEGAKVAIRGTTEIALRCFLNTLQHNQAEGMGLERVF